MSGRRRAESTVDFSGDAIYMEEVYSELGGSVVVEHCQDCDKHSGSTRHNEAKYRQYFESVYLLVGRCFPMCECESNPPDVLQRITGSRAPRMGSFEVYVSSEDGSRKQVVFSKCLTGRWPNLPTLGRYIMQVIEPNKPRPVFSEDDEMLSQHETRMPKEPFIYTHSPDKQGRKGLWQEKTWGWGNMNGSTEAAFHEVRHRYPKGPDGPGMPFKEKLWRDYNTLMHTVPPPRRQSWPEQTQEEGYRQMEEEEELRQEARGEAGDVEVAAEAVEATSPAVSGEESAKGAAELAPEVSTSKPEEIQGGGEEILAGDGDEGEANGVQREGAMPQGEEQGGDGKEVSGEEGGKEGVEATVDGAVTNDSATEEGAAAVAEVAGEGDDAGTEEVPVTEETKQPSGPAEESEGAKVEDIDAVDNGDRSEGKNVGEEAENAVEEGKQEQEIGGNAEDKVAAEVTGNDEEKGADEGEAKAENEDGDKAAE